MKTLYVIPLAAKGFVPTHPERNPVRFYAVDELERLITGGYETPGEAVRAGLAQYPDATFPDEPKPEPTWRAWYSTDPESEE